MHIEMAFQNAMMSLFGDRPGKLWASSYHKILSLQILENELRQLN